LARKSTHISILQFDEHAIVRLRVRRGHKGVDVLAYDLERGSWSASDGSLAQALKEFCAQRRVAADSVYTVLSRHAMTARILQLPSHDRDEIRSMVQLSAEEYVPFPVEELVLDQCVLGELDNGYARVLAVYAHRNLVDSHVELLEKAGIEPEQIFVSSACLASAAIAARPQSDERYAVFSLASGGLEVVVIKQRRLDFGRGVATQRDWSLLSTEDAGEALEELFIEGRASLSAYRRESEEGTGVETVFLSSEVVDVDKAAEALEQEVGATCLPAGFIDDLVTSGKEHIKHRPLAMLGAALAAQQRAAVDISLVPVRLIEARQYARLKRKAALLGAMVLLAAISLLGAYLQAIHQRETYIHELDLRISEIRPKAMEVAAKQKQLQVLKNQVSRSGTVVELLGHLVECVPPEGLVFTTILFTQNEDMVVEGQAVSQHLVDLLAENLRETGRRDVPEFAQAVVGPITQKPLYNQRVHEFKIIIPFPKEEEQENTGGTQANSGASSYEEDELVIQ